MRLFWLPSLFCLLLVSCAIQPEPETPPYKPLASPAMDHVFAKPGGVDLLVDLHMPEDCTSPPPLVVYIHGGGWSGGNRKSRHMLWLVEHGYAVACIEYRMSKEAIFPAQIHDCKGAMRWLRAHEKLYGYDASRVVVAGRSAGGHLATMMGTTSGMTSMEGDTAGFVTYSSRVQGVINYCGPQDFILRSTNQPEKTDSPGGPVFKLLGGPLKENEALGRLASPVTHVGPGDPPVLIIHGGEDKLVLLDQSERLHEVYQANGLDSHLHIEPGKRHGWPKPTPEEEKLVLEFLKRLLRADQ